jgi:hypothetical protein
MGALCAATVLFVSQSAIASWPWDMPAVASNSVTILSQPAFAPAGTLQLLGNYAYVGSPEMVPEPPKMEYITLDRSGHPVNGIPDTYQPNYKTGYDNGYVAGYDAGLLSGKQQGTAVGTATGMSDGYDKGWGDAYQPAYDLAYSIQLPIGQTAGWNHGVLDGRVEGYDYAVTIAGVVISNGNGGGGNYGGGGSASFGSLTMTMNNGWFGDIRAVAPDKLQNFYYELGFDEGNDAGSAEGSTDGYNMTYPAAYDAAFPIGYGNGTVEGTKQGTDDGGSKGYTDGWDQGYVPGFDAGFVDGIAAFLAGDSRPLTSTISINSGGSFTTEFEAESNVPEPTTLGLFGMALAVSTISCRCRK